MKLLFVGDIVGSVGRKALKETLPYLKNKYLPDFVVVNGENAAAGKGITKDIAHDFFNQGVHAITMGNHTWDKKEIFEFIDDEQRLIRPANFPQGTPGRGYTVIKNQQKKKLAVINIQGRTFLPAIECPFQTVDRIVDKVKSESNCIFVDFHAEATSEKIAMGWYLDGKVSAVVGTHTHVQTHDEVILPNGTAYVTDVGMVGSSEGILGMERTAVIKKFLTQLPVRFNADNGKWHFHALLIEIDEKTGNSNKVKLIRIYENQVIID
ncbi:TIGR00282 family metallophosphoesterase [Longirhabdus pacifica]|uniref:TIGR00282 family metallophosphoesterase n=1 Tax=Longirhabdus pacifica TaxID=2305227 RepID=UPI0013E8B67F|nr:TIGR00282 family metallophosphoesterase [Longirhabdus pacifica]